MQLEMTKGRPLPVILQFTLPLIIGNIFQQLYNMVDTSLSDVMWGQTLWQQSVPPEQSCFYSPVFPRVLLPDLPF